MNDSIFRGGALFAFFPGSFCQRMTDNAHATLLTFRWPKNFRIDRIFFLLIESCNLFESCYHLLFLLSIPLDALRGNQLDAVAVWDLVWVFAAKTTQEAGLFY